MDDPLTILRREWPVIGQASWSVTTLIILALVIGWGASRFMVGEKLESLEGRIRLRDDQIADYKDKLSGATPDEAKRRIDALELQVRALSPRRVGSDKRQTMSEALKGEPGSAYIMADIASSDAKLLSTDLAAAFQAAGWQVAQPMVGGPQNASETGLAVRVRDPSRLNQAEQAVVSALKAAGLEFDLKAGFQNPSPVHGPYVEMLLTTRAN